MTAPISQKTLTGTEMHYPVYTAGSAGTQILLFKNTGKANISLTSFEYLPGTVTKLCCQPEDTNAALGLANALLTPEEVTDPNAGSLGIRGASLTLSSDISINFYVRRRTSRAMRTPICSARSRSMTRRAALSAREELKLTGRRENGDNWVYTYTGIAAKEMGSLVMATVHGTKDGKEYTGKSLEYSVKQYAYNKLKGRHDGRQVQDDAGRHAELRRGRAGILGLQPEEPCQRRADRRAEGLRHTDRSDADRQSRRQRHGQRTGAERASPCSCRKRSPSSIISRTRITPER